MTKILYDSSEENCVRRPPNASTAGFWHLNQSRSPAVLDCHNTTEKLDINEKRTFLGVLFYITLVFCKPTHDNNKTYCDKQDFQSCGS
jgi:hypothetical protein